MNTLHFKYAVEVEKTGSISQAAENLFMAQPNLSKAIKELEDTLGIVLFKRTSKGVIATTQGKEFLEYAKSILLQLNKMESIHLTKEELEERQSFKLSMPRGSYISTAFSNFLGELDMNKSLEVEVQETNSLQTIYNVSENNYNLGIIRYQEIYENYFMDFLREKRLEHETIWKFPCLVLMSENHLLANKNTVDYKELKSTSIEIVHGDNIVPYLHPENYRADIDRTEKIQRVNVYERGSQLEMLTRVPHTFMWVSPFPQELLKRYNLTQRSCQIPNNVFKDVLIYPHGYKLTDLDKMFLNKLYQVKNEVAFIEYK